MASVRAGRTRRTGLILERVPYWFQPPCWHWSLDDGKDGASTTANSLITMKPPGSTPGAAQSGVVT